MKKYEKIYALLKTEILSGAYPYGARLPSKRTLAEENGVSLSTAETALDILRSEGYIDSAERSGFFCAYPLIPLGISTGSALKSLCGKRLLE